MGEHRGQASGERELDELTALRQRLAEAEATLDAIRNGRVDALVVEGSDGHQHVYTLESADLPYRQFLEHMAEGAVSLDADGTVLYCNRFFAELLGRPRERLLGTAFDTYLEAEARAEFRLALREGKSQRLGLEIAVGEARTVPVQLAITQTGSGDARRFTVVVTDLSERERVRELSAAREAAEAESLAKDNFLAAVGHDLRTPLNVVIGWTALLLKRRDSFDATTQRALETISRNAHLQSKLIEDLLDVSRIVSGKLRLERSEVDLSELARSVGSGLALAVADKSVTLTVHASGPIYVLGDAARLEQALNNLVGNAIKFTPAGGHVDVFVERDDSIARVRVRDTGRGVDPALLPRIFQLFRQVESLRSRESGLGLGLAITKHIIVQHEGQVWAESEGLGQGATFTMELPLHTRNQPSAGELGTPLSEAPSLVGLRVLVVDDDEDTRELIARSLRAYQAEVVSATGAAGALARLESEQFDVIVSDLMMPGTDGLELAREICERYGRNKLLIAVTGLSVAEAGERALAAGYHALFQKPIEPEALSRAMLRLGRG